MADSQPITAKPSFKPLPEHDTLNTAYLLWKIAGNVKVTDADCWEWSGGRNKAGYGRFQLVRNKWLAVHRVVHELCVAATPASLHVLHRCDNPPCCRPDHLFLGDDRANIIDCLNKGRYPNAILNPDSVRQIRALAKRPRELTLREIAARFHVNVETVRNIVYRKTWGHVE